LTTKRGRDVILGLDKHPTTPKVPLKNEIEKLCNWYNIPLPEFENNDDHIITAREESLELSDVRTDKQNILFPNKVCEFIRQLSLNPDNILYCSISGGRKTMSVHLANALSLFGREKDKLLHVLTSEENEFKDFFPKNNKEDKILELSEIPFVKLRSIISREIPTIKFSRMKYDEIVSFTQTELRKASSKDILQLITEKNELRFGSSSVRFEPLLFTIYYFFVESKLEGNGKYSIHELISKETAGRILEFINYNHPYYDSKISSKQHARTAWWNTGFKAEELRVKFRNINKKICELINDDAINEQFIISSYRVYGNTSYGIKAEKKKFRLSLPY